MAKLRVLRTNLVTTATVTASTAAIGLPSAAVQNSDRSKVWRSLTQTGVQTFDVDLGAAQTVSAFAVVNVKLLGTGSMELYDRGTGSAPVAGDGTPVGTMPAQDVHARLSLHFRTPAAIRHVRFKFTNPTAATDYAELGYVYAGVFDELGTNVAAPLTLAPAADPVTVRSSVDGQETLTTHARFTTLELTWRFLNHDTDFTTLRTLWRTLGQRTRFILVLNADRSWQAWFGRFTSDLEVQAERGPACYSAAVTFTEAR